MTRRSRRQFLEESLLATVAACAGASARTAVAEDATKQSTSPNEKLGVAVVGVRNRGGAHWGAFTDRKDSEVLWIVDVDADVAAAKAEQIAQKQRRKPRIATDMREAFADPALDIVTIATPNHWHALASIWAIQHGKDVYVEKPVSHNVSEGRRIVDAARKYKRIVQTGTQSRSMTGLREAMQFLHDGKLGDVTLAHGLCYKPRPSIGARGEYAVPASVNYDLWLGPAPQAPVTRSQFHYDWHWQWPYGNGDLGNQGIHQMDVARWGLNLPGLAETVLSYGGRYGYEDAGDTANTQVVILDYGAKTLVFEVRGLKTPAYRGAPIGVVFSGSEGDMVIASYDVAVFDKAGKIVQTFKGGTEADHYDNFVKAIRSRDAADLNADILEGHLSSALCHLGNISYQLGADTSFAEADERLSSLQSQDNTRDTFVRTKEHLTANGVDLEKSRLHLGAHLTFDPAREQFTNNTAADAYLSRDYRSPYVVPSVAAL